MFCTLILVNKRKVCFQFLPNSVEKSPTEACSFQMFNYAPIYLFHVTLLVSVMDLHTLVQKMLLLTNKKLKQERIPMIILGISISLKACHHEIWHFLRCAMVWHNIKLNF